MRETTNPPHAKKYALTSEHRAQFGRWRDRWIANAMSTAAMTEEDREACRVAVVGLYEAAGLAPPKHIVFVPSPFVLAFAGGFAAAIWHGAQNGHPGGWKAGETTRQATYEATELATEKVDGSKWYVVPDDVVKAAADLGVGAFGLQCAASAWRMWQGGNQWSAFDSYLSFFQDVVQLPLDYSKYQHWRVLAERSGPRIVHPDFCMISDRPEVLTVDAEHRPHNESGPFCRWRDGSALYAWHGTCVPARWIEQKEAVDPAEVIAASNVEQRAAGAAILGWPKMSAKLNRRIIDGDPESDIGALIELTMPGLPEPGRFLQARCPRNGIICEGVPRISDIDGRPIETALAAQAWRIGDPVSEYEHPPRRT